MRCIVSTMPDLDSYLKDPNSRRAVLEATDLPTERARNGQPTVSIRGFRLHSMIDPAAEAGVQMESVCGKLEEMLAKTGNETVTCFLCGPGLGHAISVLTTWARQTSFSNRLRIVCLETNPEIARKALQLRVWEPCDISVEWIVGADNREALQAHLNHARVTVTDTAACRVNRDAYAELLRGLEEHAPAERPMRILVPTPLYGGSLPAAFHCADAFRQLGHTVETFDLSDYYSLFSAAETATGDRKHQKVLQGLMATYLAELIAARALDWKADLVWAVAQTPLTPNALEELRHEGIHSAFWFVEDYTVFDYWRELMPHFDAVFTIQRGGFHEQLRGIGVRNVSYLPCAANPNIHRSATLNEAERARFGSDVSFVGAGYGNRQRLFADLGLRNFKIWGADWPDDSPVRRYVQENARRVTPEETALIYSGTQVNLNLHSSPHHSGINPDGDYVNPRTFEIAACGAFQLVDFRSELAGLFREGDEVAVFHREEEMRELVQHYLEHPEERLQMAERAQQRVLREHTYVHRMTAALSFLEQRFPRLAERKRGPNYISSLREAAGDDQELLDFLSGYPEDQEIDLDRIIKRIELGKGELTRAEAIFLLMKEFRDWGREKGVIQ